MNVEKLIKGYFIFVLCVLGTTMFHDAQIASNYLASVLGGSHATAEISESVDVDEPIEIEFGFINDVNGAYSKPGKKYSEIMRIHVKTFSKKAELKYLRLKLVGVHPLAVEKITIVEDDEVVKKARRENEYFVFSGLDYEFDPESETEISVRVALNEYIEPGNRLRLEIEKPKDMILMVRDDLYEAPSYPLAGYYLSVVKTRPKVRYIYTYN